ncbi:hypothetical protein HYH03_012360 [Edaphochlamys debaryana]|uniref:Gamma-soluble NSF attachment protein n=1 Tax=Edaphochlamys debaryana TaxID=47281 RepID=A0A835XSV9_9CHLO|nr:hypothetical protein HYH03_012360 [Edaphochlamys debaryana]|eukprot:KAG2489134.1 hypothetical protein HYH03_012360 [Edaphochlamys debaryana]
MSKAQRALGRDRVADMEKEAKDLMKKAKNLTGPSLLEFRFKPDWEAAAPLLERAALLYKQSGNLDKATEAYERAAQAQEKLKSPWHAAKHYEALAELSRTAEPPRMEDAARFYKMAGDLFVECNKPATAGQCLHRGARALEEPQPEEAVKLYFDALDIFETHQKYAESVDCFRSAAAFLIRQEMWDDAVSVQMRFGAVSDLSGAKYSQSKAYLGAVVTWLWAGDAEKAWATYQDAMAVETFANTEEAFAADALFEAYRTQDTPRIMDLVKSKPFFKQLDHQVAKLALRLPSPASKMRRMARKLEKLMAEPEEEGEGEGGYGEGEGGDEALL